MTRRRWTPERIEQFRRLWTSEAPFWKIAAAMGLSVKAIRQHASHLRRSRNVDLRQRAVSPGRRRANARAAYRTMRRNGDRISRRRMPNSVLSPAVIYDAQGKPIATMCPYERTRTPLV